MKKTNVRIITVLSGIILSTACFAQGTQTGGGDPTASDFQNYINEIDSYLLTDQGKLEFPELNQPEFHNIITQVKPVVKDERVYDSFGVAQACTSHVEEGNRYFQCDLRRLPAVELNNQPSFYRITFHELLFQVGLEMPISKDVPSDFSISSRLKYHVETFQKWIPGEQPQSAKSYDPSKDPSFLFDCDDLRNGTGFTAAVNNNGIAVVRTSSMGMQSSVGGDEIKVSKKADFLQPEFSNFLIEFKTKNLAEMFSMGNENKDVKMKIKIYANRERSDNEMTTVIAKYSAFKIIGISINAYLTCKVNIDHLSKFAK